MVDDKLEQKLSMWTTTWYLIGGIHMFTAVAMTVDFFTGDLQRAVFAGLISLILLNTWACFKNMNAYVQARKSIVDVELSKE